MADSVRIKRGIKGNLPKELPLGELAFCTDTKEMYVGSGKGQPLKKVIDPQVIQTQKELSEQLDNIVQQKAEKKDVEQLNIDKIGKNTSDLDINNFNESTRAMIQGLTQTEVNAVLGCKNIESFNLNEKSIIPRKTSFMECDITNLLDISPRNLENLDTMPNVTWTEQGFTATSVTGNCNMIFKVDNLDITKTYSIIQNSNILNDSNANFRIMREDKSTTINSVVSNNIYSFKPPTSTIYIRVWFVKNHTVRLNYTYIYEGTNITETWKLKYDYLPKIKADLIDNQAIGNEKITDNSLELVKLKDSIVSKNRLDLTSCLDNTRVNTTTGEYYSTDLVCTATHFIPVKPNTSVFLAYIYANNYKYHNNGHYAIYDKDKKIITGGGLSGLVSIPSNGYYIVFSVFTSKADLLINKAIVSDTLTYPTLNSIMDDYEEYYECKLPYTAIKDMPNPIDLQTVKSDWNDKVWLSYGDSITAIGNVNGQGSWQDYVSSYFKTKSHYGRGIGGQTFRWNEKVWFANADGTYNSRNDNLNYNDCQSSDIPNGCTKHRGAFCSWDRIKTMIPDNIKNDIDMIFLFGANNDGYFAYEDINNLWVPNAIIDTEWINASENVHKGDYDINKLSGAIASTIMKLQTRCPNAIIVAGTCWSGRGNADATNSPIKDGTNSGLMRVSNETLKQCYSYFSIPVVDIYNTSGVNNLNRNRYVTDMIHPYNSEGKKMLARCIVGGLKGILPHIF